MYRLTALNFIFISIFTIISLVQNEKYYMIIPILFIIVSIGFFIKISLSGSSLDFLSYAFLNFILFGVFLKLAYHLYEFNSYYKSVYFSYGNFTGKNNEYIETLCYCLLGVIAFSTSKICFEAVVGKRRSYQENYKRVTNSKFVIVIVSFFIFASLFSYFLYSNRVGIHGIKPPKLYISGVSGTLVYIRWIVIPMLWYYFYEVFVRGKNNSVSGIFIILFIFWAIVYLLHSQTKSAVILLILPLIINSFEVKKDNPGLKQYIITILMIMFGLFTIVYIGVSRNALFFASGLSYSEVLMQLPFDAYLGVFKSLGLRIEGFREVAVINSLNTTNVFDLVKATIGGFDVAGKIYGISILKEGYAFGITLGLMGNAALAQNIFIFFGYIFVTFFLLFLMVNLLSKKAGVMPFYYLSVVLFILVWSGITLFFIIRIMFMILLFNFIVYLLDIFITKSSKNV